MQRTQRDKQTYYVNAFLVFTILGIFGVTCHADIADTINPRFAILAL